MPVTILSGRVAEENWSTLEKAFEHAIRSVPSGIRSSLLVQCRGEVQLWQIITIWENRDVYDQAKEKKIISACEDLFCNAGSVPYRNEFDIKGTYTRV